MSVLIRDMKMPMNCNECPLGEYEDSEWFVCYPMNLAYRHMAQCDRLDDCPLVELPEKHGRLIDADVLLKIYSNRYEKLSERYGFDSSELGILCGASKLLDVQPVVVDTEGEE